ncbi:MAG: BolA family transcriptional regulator [Tabrizicola sp.]|nr:BolA family transcriptional regulator [Tabrizicola sp.]
MHPAPATRPRRGAPLTAAWNWWNAQTDLARARQGRGRRRSGESHDQITIRAEALAAMTRVARHRAVQKVLRDLNQRVHAIGLDAG